LVKNELKTRIYCIKQEDKNVQKLMRKNNNSIICDLEKQIKEQEKFNKDMIKELEKSTNKMIKEWEKCEKNKKKLDKNCKRKLMGS